MLSVRYFLLKSQWEGVFVTLCKNILRIFHLTEKYQVRRQLFTNPNIGPIWLKDWKMDNGGPGPAFCLAPLTPNPKPPRPPPCPWSQILRAVAKNVTVCAADIITFIVILLLVNILCCPRIDYQHRCRREGFRNPSWTPSAMGVGGGVPPLNLLAPTGALIVTLCY